MRNLPVSICARSAVETFLEMSREYMAFTRFCRLTDRDSIALPQVKLSKFSFTEMNRVPSAGNIFSR